jgi:hypothetical protein
MVHAGVLYVCKLIGYEGVKCIELDMDVHVV